MKKNLVMAAAKGYAFWELEIFLRSFKQSCKSADLVLFVDEISPFTQAKIKSVVEGVQLIEIPAELKDFAIVNSRFILYKNFLNENSGYEKIFATDIADVIFQADIFAKYDEENFITYAAESITVEDDPGGFNQDWIKFFLGEEVYQQLKNKIVLCAGTILGTAAEMKILFERLVENISDKTMHGNDQAVYINLIHEKKLPVKKLIASDVTSGEILTVSVLQNYETADGKILRGDGKAPAIVHQYNRHTELINFVDEIYREKNFDFDETFADFDSLLDEIFNLAEVRDWEIATKIFVGNLLYDEKIKTCGGKLLKLYQLILTRTAPQNFDCEVLSAAVQQVLSSALAGKFNGQQLDKLINFFNFSKQNLHTVTAPLEIFIGNASFQFAQMNYAAGEKNICAKYLEQMQRLSLPHNQDFYLMLARVYRELGEKEKALQTYRKALDAV